MQKSSLTLRIPSHTLESAKQYARQNNTTLTALIETYLKTLHREGFENAPLVRNLSGSISNQTSKDDYRRHLDRKYRE